MQDTNLSSVGEINEIQDTRHPRKRNLQGRLCLACQLENINKS